MQGLKSEFCKYLGQKSGFNTKVTFCYFCIPSEEARRFWLLQCTECGILAIYEWQNR